jgi:hypothetical protein
MILGMSIGAFTILHVIITLVAIGSGLIVVGGMFASHRLPVTTALFLFTTALTSVTGFLFPIHGLNSGPLKRRGCNSLHVHFGTKRTSRHAEPISASGGKAASTDFEFHDSASR